MKRIEFVWPDDLVERVDQFRGDVPRTKWVQRAVESALDFEACLPKPPVSSKWVDVEAHKAVHRDFAKSVGRDAMVRQRKLNEKKS